MKYTIILLSLLLSFIIYNVVAQSEYGDGIVEEPKKGITIDIPKFDEKKSDKKYRDDNYDDYHEEPRDRDHVHHHHHPVHYVPSPVVYHDEPHYEYDIPQHDDHHSSGQHDDHHGRCIEDTKKVAGDLVKEAVLKADYKGISGVFTKYCGQSNLARGFDFGGPLKKLLKPTSKRLTDPDIVSIKGFAYHSLMKKEYERLAYIFLFALYGDDLVTFEKYYECVCEERVVNKKVADIRNHENADPSEYNHGYPTVTMDKDHHNKTAYVIKAGDNAPIPNPKDDLKSCKWNMEIIVECHEAKFEKKRKLTKEEIELKKKLLIEDFSNEKFMKSLEDNSFFAGYLPASHDEHHSGHVDEHHSDHMDDHSDHRHMLQVPGGDEEEDEEEEDDDDDEDDEDDEDQLLGASNIDPSVDSAVCANNDPRAVCCDHKTTCGGGP